LPKQAQPKMGLRIVIATSPFHHQPPQRQSMAW
jgi:hypothetical protein